MPVFKQDFRETKEFTLPVSEAKVVAYDGFVADQIDKIQAMRTPKTSTIVAMILKEWDFTTEDGGPVPIDEKHVGQLHIKDIFAIIKETGLESFLAEMEAGGSTPAPSSPTSS